MRGTKNPLNLFKTAFYRAKNNKKTFPFYGIHAYMGKFGSGKTLACVDKCHNILNSFPNAKFITNTEIKGIENETYFFSSAEELVKIMSEVIEEKSTCGYIIFIDELHVVLSDLFGHSDPVFLTYLSQLRKLGVMIIGTCQLYNKCPKVVRDYLRLSGQIVFCSKYLGGFTLMRVVNMETCQEMSNLTLDFDVKKCEFFFHTTELYESYDTFAVVSQVKGLLKYDKKGSANLNGLV